MNVKYFERFRSMLEKECTNHTFAIKYVDLMRRIAQEEKSDYSEKLLDQL